MNKRSTPTILGEIGLGLPVDLTFVALSVAISSAAIVQYWLDNRANLIVGILVVAIIQLGAIYRPCKEYIDEDKNWHSFGLWLLNILVTFGVFSFLVFKVVK
ncbi:hypothetical protein CK627_07355 [Aeromonas dhakensis]|uniref:hypothetical protein n=1 Tax=Aeromonas dhakensis TaxID=196024 RepID=UPI000BAAB265|nr:hypothetical protein [Aeromonas dhakensis]ASX10616.1 hypothetical protein CK627_07355 [Aeromonas dhakensis]HDZ8828131.1 hypothetical protein [Aeromonas dhakensis]